MVKLTWWGVWLGSLKGEWYEERKQQEPINSRARISIACGKAQNRGFFGRRVLCGAKLQFTTYFKETNQDLAVIRSKNTFLVLWWSFLY